MFYRFTKDGCRQTVDLKDLYPNEDLFLIGSHPSLKQENLDLFQQPGIVTMAMNNAATVVRPNIWLGADCVTKCYSKSIMRDPAIMKFARLTYVDDILFGDKTDNPVRLRHMPNMYFYGLSSNYNHTNFLNESNGNGLVWWKNVFTMAIQLAYQLGFRRIFCVGTAFSVSQSQQYAYEIGESLNDYKIKYNQRTYDDAVKRLTKCLPHMQQCGLSIVSCTPFSKLNDHIPFQKFQSAIAEVTAKQPAPDLSGVMHSSELSKKGL